MRNIEVKTIRPIGLLNNEENTHLVLLVDAIIENQSKFVLTRVRCNKDSGIDYNTYEVIHPDFLYLTRQGGGLNYDNVAKILGLNPEVLAFGGSNSFMFDDRYDVWNRFSEAVHNLKQFLKKGADETYEETPYQHISMEDFLTNHFAPEETARLQEILCEQELTEVQEKVKCYLNREGRKETFVQYTDI